MTILLRTTDPQMRQAALMSIMVASGFVKR